MKKVFAMILAVVMVLTLSVSVCAAPGKFVQSPSHNSAPHLISVVKGSEDCTAELIITPYNERNKLPTELKTLLEKAYSEIASSDDLTKLNADLAALAATQKIAGVNLKVSDLFDIRYEGCTNQEIAERAFISEGTVKTHVHSIFRKTGSANRVQLLRAISDGQHRS